MTRENRYCSREVFRCACSRQSTVACGIFAVSAALHGPGPEDSDAARIRDVPKIRERAREANPKAIAALFTEDADQLTTAGEWRKEVQRRPRGHHLVAGESGVAADHNQDGPALVPGVAIAHGYMKSSALAPLTPDSHHVRDGCATRRANDISP
jgi:hypothetical protein